MLSCLITFREISFEYWLVNEVMAIWLQLPMKWSLHLNLFLLYVLFQIPVSDYPLNITLIVQSQYDVVRENTSLYFYICKYTRDSDCARGATTAVTTSFKSVPGAKPSNSTLIIIIGALAGALAISLIIIGVLCWKRRRNQPHENKQGFTF